MKWLFVALVSLFFALQLKLWVGEGSLREVQQLRDEIASQHNENATLAMRNSILAAEVADLKSGLTAVEERARSELGMVGQGETFFQIIDRDGDRG